MSMTELMAKSAYKNSKDITSQLADIMTNPHDLIYRGENNALSDYGANKGCVVITDDGGRQELLAMIKPLLDQYNIKISIAMELNHIGQTGRITMDDLKTLYREGHEIMSHSVNHPWFSQATEAQIISELVESKRTLRQNGMNPTNFVYPYNDAPVFAQKNVLKYYRSAAGLFDQAPVSPPLKQEALPRVGLGLYQVETTDALKARCLDAKQTGKMIIFMTHSGLAEGGVTVEGSVQPVIDIINYCVANNIEILTLDKALDRVGNISQIGTITEGNYQIIGGDKKLYTTLGNGITRLYPTELTNEKMPSYFNKYIGNTCNVLKFVAGAIDKSNPNLPLSSEGVLTIEKNSTSNGFDKQMFAPKGKTNKYIRFSISETDTWTPWENIAENISYPSTDISVVEMPSYYINKFAVDGEHKTITYRFSRQDIENPNLPITKEGVIIHHSIGTSGYFDYQEYISVDGASFRRTTNKIYSVDTWQAWRCSKPLSGTTLERPANARVGDSYFDTQFLKPIWWTGTKWVKSDGTDA